MDLRVIVAEQEGRHCCVEIQVQADDDVTRIFAAGVLARLVFVLIQPLQVAQREHGCSGLRFEPWFDDPINKPEKFGKPLPKTYGDTCGVLADGLFEPTEVEQVFVAFTVPASQVDMWERTIKWLLRGLLGPNPGREAERDDFG